MLYPQNGDRIATIDSVTALHPVYSWFSSALFWSSILLSLSLLSVSRKPLFYMFNGFLCSSYEYDYSPCLVFWNICLHRFFVLRCTVFYFYNLLGVFILLHFTCNLCIRSGFELWWQQHKYRPGYYYYYYMLLNTLRLQLRRCGPVLSALSQAGVSSDGKWATVNYCYAPLLASLPTTPSPVDDHFEDWPNILRRHDSLAISWDRQRRCSLIGLRYS